MVKTDKGFLVKEIAEELINHGYSMETFENLGLSKEDVLYIIEDYIQHKSISQEIEYSGDGDYLMVVRDKVKVSKMNMDGKYTVITVDNKIPKKTSIGEVCAAIIEKVYRLLRFLPTNMKRYEHDAILRLMDNIHKSVIGAEVSVLLEEKLNSVTSVRTNCSALIDILNSLSGHPEFPSLQSESFFKKRQDILIPLFYLTASCFNWQINILNEMDKGKTRVELKSAKGKEKVVNG